MGNCGIVERVGFVEGELGEKVWKGLGRRDGNGEGKISSELFWGGGILGEEEEVGEGMGMGNLGRLREGLRGGMRADGGWLEEWVDAV
jgi:hypothetical protein